MRTKIFPLLVVCSVCLFSAFSAFSQTSFRVDEKQAKAFFDGEKLQVVLPFENTRRTSAQRIKLEILNSEDTVLAQAETVESVRRGKQSVKISLASDNFRKDSSGVLWYRLRYTISPNEAAEFPPLSGIVSLSEIMPEIFEIRAVGSEMVFAGMNYCVKVRAFHPVSGRSAAGVKITGAVNLDVETERDEDELKVFARATTDRAGYATLDFAIPGGVRLASDADVEIKGEKNGVVREAEQELNNFEAQNLVYLEKAVQNSWDFSRYEILPDKIIVYLWANPGGTRFDFKFKPRYAINAQTAPSVVYDYYNDEARATLAPIKFSVK